MFIGRWLVIFTSSVTNLHRPFLENWKLSTTRWIWKPTNHQPIFLSWFWSVQVSFDDTKQESFGLHGMPALWKRERSWRRRWRDLGDGRASWVRKRVILVLFSGTTTSVFLLKGATTFSLLSEKKWEKQNKRLMGWFMGLGYWAFRVYFFISFLKLEDQSVIRVWSEKLVRDSKEDRGENDRTDHRPSAFSSVRLTSCQYQQLPSCCFVQLLWSVCLITVGRRLFSIARWENIHSSETKWTNYAPFVIFGDK